MMPLVALVCLGWLGWADGAPPIRDVAAEYQQAKAAAGRTPADQIRLALWCEAHGLTAERLRHLALAALADPTNATARGLAGLVARDGRWVAPDAVARTVRTDPATTALLAEYDLRRSKTPYTADAQWSLAQWADDQGLKDQAKAHFTAVTRLDPAREIAWKRLGYKKHDGRWTTDAQIAAAKAEAEAQKQADRTWKPLLEKWKGMLAQPSRKEEARTALLGVTDPRAVRSVWTVFGTSSPANQAVAVQLFGQIDGVPASLALAELAVRGESPEARRIALDILALRDPREFVGSLIRLVRTPWKYEVRPVNGPGSVGELLVEGERYNIRRMYAPPVLNPAFLPNRLFSDNIPLDAAGPTPGDLLGAEILSQAAVNNGLRGRGFQAGGLNATGITLLDLTTAAYLRDAQIKRLLQENKNDAQLAQQSLAENVRGVEAANASIQALNERVLPVLTKTTGQNFGEDHEAWARWDTDRAGYAVQSSTSDKPTFSEVVQLSYSTRTHHSCFAAGTPVRTIEGTKPIEQIVRGDLILVQYTTSGALSYQPVLTAFHNPPSSTYRVKFGEDEVVATGIHRFWKAGKGWTMARDLKVGDSLRVLGGVATVEAVEPNQTEPVFNLEVAEGRSFFVGRVGALVHDNSLVEATPNPFDAAGAVAPTPAGGVAR